MEGTVRLAGLRLTNSGSTGRGRLGVAILALALGVAGCAGSSSGDGAGSPVSQPATPSSGNRPSGKSTLVVLAVDPLGAPMVGADVRVYTYWANEDKRAVTDVNGTAEIRDVVTDPVTIEVYGPDAWGASGTPKRSANDVYRIQVNTEPVAEPTGGIARAWVSEGGLSGDGRSLEFSLQIIKVPDRRLGGYGPLANEDFALQDCTPDAANDATGHQPDCVAGPAGFDAPYAGAGSGAALEVRQIPAASTIFDWEGFLIETRFAAALLLDQSAGVIVNDPADKRLFAAKYLFNYLARDQIPAVLGAFAADEPASARFSALPQKPLSLFPLEDPQFTVDERSHSTQVDSLAVMEGGAQALFAAVDRTLDFHADHPGPAKRAIVVVTDGRDETCGTPAACRQVMDSLVEKTRAAGVAVVTIGLGGDALAVDRATLGLLAQAGAGGASFWVADPSQLAPTLEAAKQYLADAMPTVQARFRLESPVAGAFAPGRTVTGWVKYVVACPFECVYSRVPFVVKIPAAG